MNSIYVFYGEEDFLINKAILDIVNKNTDHQLIKFDLKDTNISQLLEDASMMSLFEDKKIIIGYNASFLTGETTKDNLNHNIDQLSRYIDNPNPNVIIILTVVSDKLDKRKTIVKKIIEKTKVKSFDKLKEPEMVSFVRDIFKENNYIVSTKAINDLVSISGSNLFLLNNECKKLMLYKLDEQKIDDNDIVQMVERYDFDNVFALTDAVIKKDIDKSLLLYQELVKRGEEPIKIIVLLANQFRLIFQAKGLHAKGLTNEQIASNLGVHPYRVKLANEVQMNSKELLRYIGLLADLDESIKMGKQNKNIGLELFLLKL